MTTNLSAVLEKVTTSWYSKLFGNGAFNCDTWEFIKFKDFIVPTVFYGVLFFLAIFWIVVGFRYAKITFFTSTLFILSPISYFVLLAYFKMPYWANYLIPLACGSILGLLGGGVKPIGCSLIGFFSGAAIALNTLFFIGIITPITSYWIPIIPFAVFGVLGGVFSLWKPSHFTIFSIVNVGGMCMFAVFDYFLGNFMIHRFAIRLVYALPIVSYPCLHSWLFMIVWLVSIILGCALQYLITSKDLLDPPDSRLNGMFRSSIYKRNEHCYDDDALERSALV